MSTPDFGTVNWDSADKALASAADTFKKDPAAFKAQLNAMLAMPANVVMPMFAHDAEKDPAFTQTMVDLVKADPRWDAMRKSAPADTAKMDAALAKAPKDVPETQSALQTLINKQIVGPVRVWHAAVGVGALVGLIIGLLTPKGKRS